MPAVNQSPFVMRDAVLTLGGDTYNGIALAVLNPETPVVTYKSITGSVTKDRGTPDWTLQIRGCQDHDTANALVSKLSALSASVTGSLKPKGTGTAVYTFTIIPVPTQIGGTADEIAEFTVDLPVVGQPVKTP